MFALKFTTKMGHLDTWEVLLYEFDVHNDILSPSLYVGRIYSHPIGSPGAVREEAPRIAIGC